MKALIGLGVIGLLSLLIACITLIVFGIQFDRNCGGYLKRAADASSVELAKEQLDKALAYMKGEGWTEGYTSIVYRTPDEDVGFWYTNVKQAREELDKVGPETTPLERTNMLMKLRETLLDQGKEGVSITSPEGISRYPHNGLILFWWLGSLVLCCGFLGFIEVL